MSGGTSGSDSDMDRLVDRGVSGSGDRRSEGMDCQRKRTFFSKSKVVGRSVDRGVSGSGDQRSKGMDCQRKRTFFSKSKVVSRSVDRGVRWGAKISLEYS